MTELHLGSEQQNDGILQAKVCTVAPLTRPHVAKTDVSNKYEEPPLHIDTHSTSNFMFDSLLKQHHREFRGQLISDEDCSSGRYSCSKSSM